MRILITGAAGQLGSTIVERFAREHDVLPVTRGELDVTEAGAVAAFVARARPSAIINCAAYTDVDGAEENPVAALEGNAFAVRSLARAAAGHGATLVHYSTDFVFDGAGSRPYTEADQPNPRSVYAASKLLGEWFARDAPLAYVLRVESLFGGDRARSSVDRIVDAVLSGREARVFVDRTVSPSFVRDVAAATEALLVGRAPAGVYHCVNSGFCTWHELAQEVVRHVGATEARLRAVSTAEVPLKAPRPRFAALSNAKLAAAGFAMPGWQDALRRYLAERSPRGHEELLNHEGTKRF